MRVTPHASSLGEWGIMTNPTCLPGRSKSTVAKAGVVGELRSSIVVLVGSVGQRGRQGSQTCSEAFCRSKLLPRRLPENRAALDHASDVAQRGEILQRIAVENHNVGE